VTDDDLSDTVVDLDNHREPKELESLDKELKQLKIRRP
jgi:hypothetical protein